MALKVYSAPAVEPISSTEANLHLRVDISDDNTLIAAQIKAARETAEQILRRALITQTWDYVMDEFPSGDEIKLPLPPLQSVTSITYYKSDGSSATVSSASYNVDTYSEPGRIVLKSGYSWPGDELRTAAGVVVRYVAGYGDAGSNVPGAIRQAILLLIGDMYENRENQVIGSGLTVTLLQRAADDLLWPYRVLEF